VATAMGSSFSYGLGYTAAHCGCADACGIEGTTKAIMHLEKIEPWSAKDRIMVHLQKQEMLARKTPLRHVPVQDGLNHFTNHASGILGGMTEAVFRKQAIAVLNAKGIKYSRADEQELTDVFKSMDYDDSGRLSLGEWAGGMTVFFRGSREDCVHAVFEALDADHNGTLSRQELREYLKPFVKAMVPEEAAALRPVLLKKATDDIFDEMDHFRQVDECITSEEMILWMQDGNNIIDRLVKVIDPLVYKIWLEQKTKTSTWSSFVSGSVVDGHAIHHETHLTDDMASAHRNSVFGGAGHQGH